MKGEVVSIKIIRQAAQYIRSEMERMCGFSRLRCHEFSDALVDRLKSIGFLDARKITVIVFYDDYYAAGAKRDVDAWNPHQVVMVGDMLVDISGDQFNGHDDEGYGMIVSKSRMIPPVNVVSWLMASGGGRPVYGFPSNIALALSK
jgi:hypothetical protein